ncbi:MAG TPA: acetate kinase [Amycolatopsis sp.]|uniref:acetate/propionate family kinase n=1 Tax=Amycolatopsis sp. TaxID=37632 RepID=UPI002B46B8A8|nr:acetate kinase [Amycolatopsis sp.]HKS48537.1 acetate kinase [Amycolatopsis sp.]
MRILTLNPGSSSLKAAVVVDDKAVATRTWPASDARADERAVAEALTEWGNPDAVAVRFVHGGSRPGPALLDEHVLDELDRLAPLAPLHQPLSIDVARLVTRLLPGIPVVGCFDTSFHSRLPEAAARYALPRAWTSQHRLRRYGFHGLSCSYAARRAAELLGRKDPHLVCAHIGSGVSVTAISDGASVDTSMGFTPLDGAVMATRPGSVDPGVLLHVLATGEITLAELADALYHRSGLAGMTATDGDVRTVLTRRAAGDRAARDAISVYAHRLRREIGAAAMSLDRLDAVVFTGGVAEHQPDLLGEIVDGCGMLGLRADPARLARSGDRRISHDGATPALLVLAAREDLEIARAAERKLSSRHPPLSRVRPGTRPAG